ncbi:MAG: tetratricopeptide repeat protein [Chitinophagaceae bacterium]
MDTSILLSRAQLLLDQGRHSDARINIRQALELEPQNDYALSLLGRCFYANKQYKEGIDLVNQAIALDPVQGFYFYLVAFGYYQKDENRLAIENLQKALQLNPYNAEYYGLLAYVLLQTKEFVKALEKANEGLAIEGDNITCLNARSVALNKLKQTDAAIETMQSALAQDPDNEMTHATVGWNLLEKGRHKKAMGHFLEALRIHPNYDSARSGLKEALKSKVPPYRWLLQYSFWIQNKGKKWQTFLPIALYIVFRLLIYISSEANQSSLVWLLGGLYILLVVTSWTINSIANFFLLFNRVGKYALSVSEKWTAITAVSALVSGIVLVSLSFVLPAATNTVYSEGFLIGGVVLLSLALPLSALQYPLRRQTLSGWRKWYPFILVLAGVAGLLALLVSPPLAITILVGYGLAFLVYNWTRI